MIPFDTECYKNFWLIIIGDVEISTTSTLTPEQCRQIRTLLNAGTCVSFNGLRYDIPMVASALAGNSVEMLKHINDRIILDNAPPWNFNPTGWAPADHVDLFNIAPGACGQKIYAGRMHAPTMRDLPYSPDSELTPDQMREVTEYCHNDVAVLSMLADSLHAEIGLRRKLSARYGLDLMSKSDAQIAEAVLKLKCGAVGAKPKPYPAGYSFTYKAPDYLSVPPEIANARFVISETGTVTMPEELKSLSVKIGNSTYTLGIGGLHSNEHNVAHVSDAENVLIDSDVASYYPQLIINSGLFPPILGAAFRREYIAIKNERIAAKHATIQTEETRAMNDGGKIMINGTFGKTGSPYSVLYAPEMMIYTTLTGQLSLLMLIRQCEEMGIPIVSANTDGIVAKCPRNKHDLFTGIVKRWEKITNLEMEQTEYKGLYSRDVNSYFAVKASGGIKRKGAFATASLRHNPNCEIVSDALAAYFEHGTPVADTVRGCRDIRKFVVVRKVAGGAEKLRGDCPEPDMTRQQKTDFLLSHGWTRSRMRWVRDDCAPMLAADAVAATFPPQRREYLGKVVRWYYSTNSRGHIVYANNGNKVGDSWGAEPCMTLPDTLPDDVDFDVYIKKAEGFLNDIDLH